MNVSPKETKRRMGRFLQTLKEADIRVTHQRMEIFREVARTDEHPNLETIFKGVPYTVPSGFWWIYDSSPPSPSIPRKCASMGI